jgi:hypothetical protein
MYLYGLYAVALASLLATAWLQVTAAGIVAAGKHLAVRYANAALERAQDDALDSLAAQVGAGGAAGPFVAPSPAPPYSACATAPCAFVAATNVQLAGQTASGAGESVAANLQANTGVGEGRVAVLLASTITNANGGILARATRRITVRTFAAPPYVALSGVDEPVAGNANVADFAGSCDGSAACGSDTRIHALLRCNDPVTPANCAGQGYRPADAFATSTWHNAAASTAAWSR